MKLREMCSADGSDAIERRADRSQNITMRVMARSVNRQRRRDDRNNNGRRHNRASNLTPERMSVICTAMHLPGM
jgi:hypothetical protein